ncbi:MAG TPA: hypothetical protein VMS12_07750 [Thermoanaerobaculia bacterium]|nr:hypothetical protein [Thermoanaerobaculia bacterium]
MKPRFVWQDVTLRVLIIVSGGIAAALFVLRGEGEFLPALAIGGMLGAFLVTRSESEEG